MNVVLHRKYMLRGSKVLIIILVVSVCFGVLWYFYNQKVYKIDSMSKLTFNAVVVDNAGSYVGKEITWLGQISGNSQIDGIKFNIIDQDHKVSSDNNWFWAIPPDFPTSAEINGQWAVYMLSRFGNIDNNQIVRDRDFFLVTGLLEKSDCTFYDGGSSCIPQVIVKKIELVNNK